MPKSPLANGVNGRDGKGRFAAGNAGGPGNPYVKQVAKLRSLLVSMVSEEDLVRYAETKGHEFDYEITGAWRFRDYLIRAFNEDIPYDQLVREHLAGDLLNTVRRNPEIGINESHIGTAFYILGEGTHSPVDVRQDEHRHIYIAT